MCFYPSQVLIYIYLKSSFCANSSPPLTRKTSQLRKWALYFVFAALGQTALTAFAEFCLSFLFSPCFYQETEQWYTRLPMSAIAAIFPLLRWQLFKCMAILRSYFTVDNFYNAGIIKLQEEFISVNQDQQFMISNRDVTGVTKQTWFVL